MKTVRVAAAVICDAAERPAKVFATARGYGEFKGRWEFPGGKIEPGETARQALVREIREELSVTVEPLELLGTIEYDYPGFHLSMDCFACALRDGEIVLREALEARWLGAGELDEIDWLPADRELLGALHALLETPSPRDLERLDALYGRLERRRDELLRALSGERVECGWYSGHYHRQKDGQWAREAWPIPVIAVKGLCDVEIQFDALGVSAKLTREAALECAFEAAQGVPFEAYGVEDYLADYYRSGQPIETLRERVRASTEGEIGFAFTLPFETEGARLHDFLRALRAEGFFY